MIKTTRITEKHSTSAGLVEAEVTVTVSGPNDGVARIDRDFLKHIKELRPASIANPVERIIDNGSVTIIAPAQPTLCQVHAPIGDEVEL